MLSTRKFIESATSSLVGKEADFWRFNSTKEVGLPLGVLSVVKPPR